ncbi:MAG: hypothetical protein NVS1B2_16000 [Vulcanimicrobiaceae bacterium]
MRLYAKHQWFRENHMPVRIVICKSRRAGLSTGVEALIYDDTTTHANTYSLIVANEKNPSENILNMCRTFWKHTPEKFVIGGREVKLRPDIPSVYKNNPPKDRLEFDVLNSFIVVATARSIDAYLGYGFQNMHATEASRYNDGHELFRALYPTLSSDEHSALYIESTPNGQDGKGRWFYEQCMDAHARKKTQYGEMALVFIPWHEMRFSFAIPFKDDTARRSFARGYLPVERDLLKRFPSISPEQFQWRRMVVAGPTFNRDEDMFDQEYPTDLATAFLTSGTSVYGRKYIKNLMARTRDPVWEGDVYWGESPEKNSSVPIHELVRRPMLLTIGQARAAGFPPHVNEKTYKNLKIYRHVKKGERVFVTCDVGGGSESTKDGDQSTICVGVLNELDRDELVMTWRGRINPIAFGEVASALAWAIRYQVGESVVAPLLVPEWTGPGTAMCTYIDSKNLYPALYRYQQPGIHKMPASKHIGWESNAKTKPMMVAYSVRMVAQDLIDLPDEDLVMQMSSYRQTDSFGDSGSYGGAAGRHDDLVSSFQILCAVLRIHSATLPGDVDVEEIDLFAADDDDDLPFDPYNIEIPGMPGVTLGDVDDEGLEESMWYGR